MIGDSSSIGHSASSPASDLTLHKLYPGDVSSTTILLDELTPYSLGHLIALYEHKVFVMACVWRINPFDQWGVELGKNMAVDTLDALKNESFRQKFDESTNGLINFIYKHNSRMKAQ